MREDTDTDIPADKIDLYLRVAALAEKGAPGEREQAARTLAKMRIRYPGIEFIAEEKIKAERRASRRTGEPKKPAGTPKEAFWSAYTKTFESVSKILADIDRLLGDLGGTQEAIAAIDETLEVRCVQAKVKGEEKFRLIVDLDSDVLTDAIDVLDGDKKALRAIAEHIGRQIADALAESLSDEGDDDADDDDEDEDDDD
ncbi:MAG: hypothetical protein KGS10_04505 [Chloroflexi bacterium]|nr:hypothetical protein [Chloroflexota bacterium]